MVVRYLYTGAVIRVGRCAQLMAYSKDCYKGNCMRKCGGGGRIIQEDALNGKKPHGRITQNKTQFV